MAPKMESLQRMGGHSHPQISHPSTNKIQSPRSRKTPTLPTSVDNTSLQLTPTATPQVDLQIQSPRQGRYPMRPVHHRNIPSLRPCFRSLHITSPQRNSLQTIQANYQHNNQIWYVNGLLTYQSQHLHLISRQWHDPQNSLGRSIPRPYPSANFRSRNLSLIM